MSTRRVHITEHYPDLMGPPEYRVTDSEAPPDGSYTVNVDTAELAAWKDAEAAYRAAEATLAATQVRVRALYEAAETAWLESLPPPDPDAPPPGPISDHFPAMTTTARGLTYGRRSPS